VRGAGKTGVLALAVCAACAKPDLELSMEPITFYVGETDEMTVHLVNRTGVMPRFSYAAPPELVQIEDRVFIATRMAGAVLEWTPILQDVGTHRFEIRASAGSKSASIDVNLTVERARPGAPSFSRSPRGAAFDPFTQGCIDVPITVVDRSGDPVEIGVWSGLPPRGAKLESTGTSSASLHWCPTPDQIASDAQRRITLYAKNSMNRTVLHDLTVVLLIGDKHCEGTPPAIDWRSPAEDQPVVSMVGYDAVADFSGIDAAEALEPILFFSNTRQDSGQAPDPTGFQLARFFARGPDWVAHVPTFRLAPDEKQTITLIPYARDDADTGGSRCDHQAPLLRRRFLARGAVEAGIIDLCGACVESGDCISGVCAATPLGGRCIPMCSKEEPCKSGDCGTIATTEGALQDACVDAAGSCFGEAPCEPDQTRDNRSPDKAMPLDASGVEVRLCPREEQWFSVAAFGASQPILLSPADSGAKGIMVEVVGADGRIVAATSGTSALACMSAPERLLVHVFGRGDAAGGGRLSAPAPSAGACCSGAAHHVEPRTLVAGAPLNGLICPGETGELRFAGDPTARMAVDLGFDAAKGDLDVLLLDADGSPLAVSRGTGPSEHVEIDPIDGRTYQARAFVDGYLPLSFTATLTVTPLQACRTSTACGEGEVCTLGRCRRIGCTRGNDCPSQSTCALLVPGADRQLCSPSCSGDADCPPTERCKWFREGKACAREGSGVLGAACRSATDCTGLFACLPWPGGYCGAIGCATDPTACGPGGLCIAWDGTTECARACWISSDECRLQDGYVCGTVRSSADALELACVGGA
jgi:hypothetical protein